MLNKTMLLAAALNVVACAGADLESSTAPTSPTTTEQSLLAVRAGELAFRPCPGNLPAGCEMAVVEGNPAIANTYTIRFRSSTPLNIVPHSHPSSERITVLEGTVYVGKGDTVDKTKATEFGPGDFYMFEPGTVHYLWTDGPIELQATGVGPREFHRAGESH